MELVTEQKAQLQAHFSHSGRQVLRFYIRPWLKPLMLVLALVLGFLIAWQWPFGSLLSPLKLEPKVSPVESVATVVPVSATVAPALASSAGAVPMPTPFGLAHLNSLAADGAQYRLPGALRIPAQAVSHPSLLGLDAVPRAMPGGVAGTQPKRQAKAKVLATPVAVPDNAAPAVLSAAPAVASAEPLLSIRRSRSSVATAQIQQAQKLWQQGQLEQGRELLETALGQWPAAESWPVAKILLQHYLQHRAWQSAATIADKPWPQAQQAWARSMLLNAQGQSQAALALLTPLSPSIKQLEFYQLKAALLHKTQNYGAAAALYRRLLERQPNAGAYWLGLASCLEALHQPDAVAAYVKARQTNSGQAQVLSFIDKRLRVLGANRAQNAIEVSLHE